VQAGVEHEPHACGVFADENPADVGRGEVGPQEDFTRLEPLHEFGDVNGIHFGKRVPVAEAAARFGNAQTDLRKGERGFVLAVGMALIEEAQVITRLPPVDDFDDAVLWMVANL